MIGATIYIYWEEDLVWYQAKVLKYFENFRKFKIVYDDKNQERIDLAKQQFVIEDENYKKKIKFGMGYLFVKNNQNGVAHNTQNKGKCGKKPKEADSNNANGQSEK